MFAFVAMTLQRTPGRQLGTEAPRHRGQVSILFVYQVFAHDSTRFGRFGVVGCGATITTAQPILTFLLTARPNAAKGEFRRLTKRGFRLRVVLLANTVIELARTSLNQRLRCRGRTGGGAPARGRKRRRSSAIQRDSTNPASPAAGSATD